MRRWTGFLVLAITAGLWAGTIDPAEFECEEAVARLEHCCGHDYSSVGCGGGCDGVDFSIDFSTAVRNSSCEEILERGYCHYAAAP